MNNKSSGIDCVPSTVAALTFTDGWQNFICYLIDKCEGERVTEEALHRWAAEFLQEPRYRDAKDPSQ